MPDFKFVAVKNVDASMVQVIMYEIDRDCHHECGTNILTPESWEAFKEQVLRTKVKCEG